MGYPNTGTVGRQAEQLAFEYLIEQKLSPLARNFHCRGGEIDLIMLDSDQLVFVEVRFRRSSSFAPAGHTVDHHKQRKLVRTAAMFITKNHRFSTYTMRFDVIAIEGVDDPTIRWIKDAFRPNNSTL